jgi:hypothetical protein
MRFSHVGVQFALSVGAFVALGIWGDTRLGTTPLFTLLGVMAGFGIGFYHLYKSIYGVGGMATKTRTPGGTHAPDASPRDGRSRDTRDSPQTHEPHDS